MSRTKGDQNNLPKSRVLLKLVSSLLLVTQFYCIYKPNLLSKDFFNLYVLKNIVNQILSIFHILAETIG